MHHLSMQYSFALCYGKVQNREVLSSQIWQGDAPLAAGGFMLLEPSKYQQQQPAVLPAMLPLTRGHIVKAAESSSSKALLVQYTPDSRATPQAEAVEDDISTLQAIKQRFIHIVRDRRADLGIKFNAEAISIHGRTDSPVFLLSP